jgi:two-component system response regulator AtoC
MNKNSDNNILLIEPSEPTAERFKKIFELAGYKVTIVENRAKAEDAQKKHRYSSILENITEAIQASEEVDSPYKFTNIISKSRSMLEIFETVKRLTNFKTTILISGESGTGKELLARAIHCNSSRAKNKFVAINCGAIPENLIESELFGHKTGSFTDAVRDRLGLFEEANGGTVFLDEIGELPLHLQVKLLRVLQEQTIRRIGDEQDKKIDVRILAASHKNLEEAVKDGAFREDLFYRLNVVHIHLPPLRERPEDLEVLIDHLIKKHNRKMGTSVRKVSDEVLTLFKKFPWRGNIRELENTIERGLVLAEGDTITLDCLPDKLRTHTETGALPNASKEFATSAEALSIKQQVRGLEIHLITKALEKTNGNRTHAAKLLEISHRTLLYKLKEYQLSDDAE